MGLIILGLERTKTKHCTEGETKIADLNVYVDVCLLRCSLMMEAVSTSETSASAHTAEYPKKRSCDLAVSPNVPI
jgi:hypothetical protein